NYRTKIEHTVRVCMVSQVFRLKLFALANRTTRDHEDALAPVMHSLGIPWGGGHMSFDDLPDEQPVFRNQTAVGQATFKICIALFYQRCADLCSRHRCKPELFEFVHVRTGAVADANNLVQQSGCSNVDDTFLAAANHLEAVVSVGDTTEERRRELQHH